MNRSVYEGLVDRLEAEAKNRPIAFRGKVILLSTAAYVMLFGALFGTALLLYLGFDWAYSTHQETSFLFIVLGVVTAVVAPVFFAVLRMFFTRLEPPQGRAILPQEAPHLFRTLDRIRKKMDGPPIHHVLIDKHFNAGILQLPKWGCFGGHTNYLTLGLPYLLAAPTREMVAIIAHEYGHICRNHGKLSAWVYRQRRTFRALYQAVNIIEPRGAPNAGNHGEVAAVADRFMPYYNACTFVLSRQQEYQADLAASELVGAEINASGLIRGALLGKWIREEFWPKLFKQADTMAQPAGMPFASMRAAFKAGYEQWATPASLEALWRETSNLHDTHPSLRDRVEATGHPPQLPARTGLTAADVLLGPVAARLIHEFDQAWWNEGKQVWEARYQYVTRSRLRLQKFSRRPLLAMKLHELHEFALLKSEFDSPQQAKPALEHLLRQPGGPFPRAAYVYGRFLLDEGNERGLEHLAVAANTDPDLARDAAQAGYFFLLEKRGKEAAKTWWGTILYGASEPGSGIRFNRHAAPRTEPNSWRRHLPG